MVRDSWLCVLSIICADACRVCSVPETRHSENWTNKHKSTGRDTKTKTGWISLIFVTDLHRGVSGLGCLGVVQWCVTAAVGLETLCPEIIQILLGSIWGSWHTLPRSTSTTMGCAMPGSFGTLVLCTKDPVPQHRTFSSRKALQPATVGMEAP